MHASPLSSSRSSGRNMPPRVVRSAEAQFALRGITQEDTKYFYVVAALNSSTASREQTAGECGDIRNASGFSQQHRDVQVPSALSSADMFQRLLMDFPDLTTPTFSSAAVKHGVDHFIATTGPPVHARARRLDPQKLAVAKAEFDSMERLGIVHDILVASVTSDEHQAHLRPFARLSEHGLIINLAKCQFGVPVVDFLATASPGKQRQLAFVSEFTTDIQHAAGKDNVGG
ncbi:hypothetical protein AAFF_G00233480 [Aldrovandia affinis]|uniref:Uncharacterized protein n=1 Tax=Aldrovandia affinis TaxID=143900 RepID=A0AAD7W468_9TELE|nr:hypothetical protein AAFF_G00233480 [Aldrovandia affinis]